MEMYQNIKGGVGRGEISRFRTYETQYNFYAGEMWLQTAYLQI